MLKRNVNLQVIVMYIMKVACVAGGPVTKTDESLVWQMRWMTWSNENLKPHTKIHIKDESIIWRVFL